MSLEQPFKGWTQSDVETWRSQQNVQRSYRNDLVSKIKPLNEKFNIVQYGQLSYDAIDYPLYLITTRNTDANKPNVLITGGVHGYETSGSHGAVEFMATKALAYESRFNLICAP